MRICLIYDCLFPWTVGGAERWLRRLAEALAAEGHAVTYLTRRQWDPDDPPEIPGVDVVAVSRADGLYGPGGERRIAPPLRFGAGVARHLLRHRGEYDVVHACAFPYFSVLAAGLTRTRPLYVDWCEVWSEAYWRDYLGGPAGRAGSLVQRACARVPQQAFTFSELHAQRLLAAGHRGTPIRLGGLAAPVDPAAPAPDADSPRAAHVVFAGRHIPEKAVEALPAALAVARRTIPDLHATLFGDGPTRPKVLAAIEAAGATGYVEAPGFAAAADVEAAIARAAVMVLPSRREGYGIVVVEAFAAATPAVVVAGEDNAAVELVEPGVNGIVAPSASAEDLGAAIVAAIGGGAALRASTARWYSERAEAISVEHSVGQVLAAYAARGGR